MNQSLAAGSGNTLETLAAALREFRTRGLRCDIFGGWSEELLAVREPWEHCDIDLIYRGENLLAFDAIVSGFTPVRPKRFHHKRAFLFRDILCEVILVQDAAIRPVTHYWGDVPFYWDQPLLHPQAIDLCGETVTLVSVENLQKHRRMHRETQPHRWRDPKSLVP